MTLTQKLKIRFVIFSTIIFVVILWLLFLQLFYKQLVINENWFLDFSIVIGVWFWADTKLFYIKHQLIVCFLLSLLYLVVVNFANHSFLATIPFACFIGRFIGNKQLDTVRKMDLETIYTNDYDDNVFINRIERRQSLMFILLATCIISSVIWLIVKLIITLWFCFI